MKQLQEELGEARGEDRAAVQKEIDGVKKKLEVMRAQARNRSTQLEGEVNAKVASLMEQIKQAGHMRKAKLERRVADVRADWGRRSAKLERAEELAKEALRP